MKIRNLFWVFSLLLVVVLAVISYYVLYQYSQAMFFAVEVLVFLVAVFLYFFYSRIIKPLNSIGNGMDLLKAQDFSSRLSKVGQSDADRIVELFNKLMKQLKDERLKIREQNHFLDLLIKASPMGVVILSLDKDIQTMNEVACKMFDVEDESEVIGMKLSTINSYIAKELSAIPVMQSRILRLSDANIYKCTHSSFVDHGFQHSFFLLEVLTTEVAAAERKAYETIIRMIAHEVNNTTAGMVSTLDTILSSFEGKSNTDVGEVLRITIERCYGMSRFISSYADVVRIPEPMMIPTDINNLVVSCNRFMENLCKGRNINVVTELTESPLTVNIDIALFEQVLLNIIKNAVESIESNGTISIRTSTNPISLEIADNGKGISREAEEKLFSPFFSTKPNGQGLGLIFIREVLTKHRCTFSLHTYDDGLTRFRIFFK
jgi:Signal transduction histidine kinase involved in nitrogen fixation and metabolism regulation